MIWQFSKSFGERICFFKKQTIITSFIKNRYNYNTPPHSASFRISSAVFRDGDSSIRDGNSSIHIFLHFVRVSLRVVRIVRCD